MNRSFWSERRVFLTGHTGFKGSWMALWLQQLGARVHGYALDPITQPSLFESLGLEMAGDTRGDLRDLAALRAAARAAEPEVVFHLAAQPLVRESYQDPVGTFATNVLGTAHLLESLRGLQSLKTVVVITTDKVYHNEEWAYPYRESDRLGGKDPYSASKAAAELVTASYRDSFLAEQGVRVVSARAGNVIGGGDWSADRLVPDCLRAFAQGQPVELRYPQAVRPWQHVLEPLSGYLLLAQREGFEGGWNFGPKGDEGHAEVGQVVESLARLWGEGARAVLSTEKHPREAGLLRLDISKAQAELGWQPRWSLEQALAATVDWQKGFLAGTSARELCLAQIRDFSA
ncbi:CDP-glucose 4,6-dehydratase [bacterium SCN 62-11]|nr:CDP-glucose 4,6-dehydratase [Candidatus Eremiobacteraeota bacterium]ODT58664.1 MAG: CDP-glucose 4,6-dehydratase [bacterium SCN 62-11]